ncbi:unnamed protein product [Closterium sp. Naga37s-1]|nr:unnamed protein product [Closterium sp. Naga37s-1]
MSLQLVQSYDSDEEEARLKSAAFEQGDNSSDSSGSDSEDAEDAEDAEAEDASRNGENSGGKENAGGAATAGRNAGGALAAGRIGGVRRTAAGFLPEKGPSGLPSAAAAFEAVRGTSRPVLRQWNRGEEDGRWEGGKRGGKFRVSRGGEEVIPSEGEVRERTLGITVRFEAVHFYSGAAAIVSFPQVGGPPSFLAPTALSHHMHIARAGKLVAMGSANEEAPRGIVTVAGAPAAAPAAVVYRERRAGGVGGGAREIVAAPVRNPNAPAAEPAAVEGGEEGAEGSDAANGDATRGRKAVGVSMPPKADAVDLLRICPTCQVPKTPSSGQGVVCPICRDRPAGDADVAAGREKSKRREGDSKVKDKEKSKRMKGQSSHATWKSETEMQLRQTYD